MQGMRSERELLIQGVCNKIEAQFPEDPEAKLLFAIIKQAIKDVAGKNKIDRRDAIRYLNHDIPV